WGSRCRKCFFERNRGKSHSSWKGTSALSLFLRTHLTDWRLNSLKLTDNKCDISGAKGELHVQHKYPFHRMVKDMLSKLDIDWKETMDEYTAQEVESMIIEIKMEHSKRLGVALAPDIHRFYHSLFGYDNNEGQYEFFRTNYYDLLAGTITAEDFNSL